MSDPDSPIKDENRILMRIVTHVEWVGKEGKLHCPWCRRYQEYGHKEDCELHAVLNEAKK